MNDVLLYPAVAPSIRFRMALWVVLVTCFLLSFPLCHQAFHRRLGEGETNPSVGFGVVLR